MDNINIWMNTFIEGWKNHDIESVLNLFANDVEYRETPFNRIFDFNDLKNEWNNITEQNNIEITYDAFSKASNKYTIIWDLKYFNNQTTQTNHIKGIYLITLNSNNKCVFFFQCGETETQFKEA